MTEKVMAKVRGGRRIELEEEAGACLGEVERSGMTLHAWCRANGVHYDSLYRWSKRLARSTPAEVPLVELTVRPTPPEARSLARYTIVIGRKRVVVGDDFAEGTLSRLLRVVAAC